MIPYFYLILTSQIMIYLFNFCKVLSHFYVDAVVTLSINRLHDFNPKKPSQITIVYPSLIKIVLSYYQSHGACRSESWHACIKRRKLDASRLHSNNFIVMYDKSVFHLSHTITWGLWCQKQVSQVRMSNCIPQYSVGYNYLALPEITTSCNKVFIYTITLNTGTHFVFVVLFCYIFVDSSIYIYSHSSWLLFWHQDNRIIVPEPESNHNECWKSRPVWIQNKHNKQRIRCIVRGMYFSLEGCQDHVQGIRTYLFQLEHFLHAHISRYKNCCYLST